MSSIALYSSYATQLQTIEQELQTQPVSREVRQEMLKALDEIHQGLSQMDTTADSVHRFATGFLDDLRQKAVFLYGEVDNFFHKHSIEVIRQTAETLTQNLSQNNLEKIKDLVSILRSHVHELLASYSPGFTERRVLVIASLALEQAKALLQGSLAEEVVLDEATLANAEMFLEELAEYLGAQDRFGLKQIWNRLSPQEQKIVRAYLDPENSLPSLLHDVERPANDHKVFRIF
jgi:hypothetical protein